jgi:hypothetical protein
MDDFVYELMGIWDWEERAKVEFIKDKTGRVLEALASLPYGNLHESVT